MTAEPMPDMGENSLKTAENRQGLGELDGMLAQLSTQQIKFLLAYYDNNENAAEACRVTKISPSTETHWPPEVRALIRQASKLMSQDGVVTALHLRRRNLARAMTVKVEGLDSASEKVRQAVATELIEWELGKARQLTELTGKDGAPVAVGIYLPDNGRDHDSD